MKKNIIYAFLVFLVIGLGYFYFWGNGGGNHQYITVSERDIVQEVSVTGKVRPVSSASLAFDRVGRISRFNVDVGSRVGKGEVLAILENSEIVAAINQAEANVRVQEAKLDELKRGTRPEEIQIAEAQVDGARSSLADAQKGLIEKINDAYTKSDDAIRNRVDRMFNNSKSPNPSLVFVVSDVSLSDQIEFERFVLEGMLNDWSLSLSGLSMESDLVKYISEAKDNLNKIKSFLDKLSLAVNGLVANSSLSQNAIDTYKTETATARTNTNSSISNLIISNEKLRAADSSLRVLEQQLALKRAGTSEEQIRAQEALLEQAVASVDSSKSQLNKTVLRSPIQGVITKKYFGIGEIVSANTPVLEVISGSQFEIEANVPEADVAKVSLGDEAKVTLDAYGSDVLFPAVVIKIDPAETILEGVATYKTTFNFLNKDDRIKSGMTANIDIMTDKKNGVVAVPQRAITSRGGVRFVMVYTGKEDPEERIIEVGLRGSDGYTEILSGIVVGDRIVGLVK
jgi:HlyD family secretion protein